MSNKSKNIFENQQPIAFIPGGFWPEGITGLGFSTPTFTPAPTSTPATSTTPVAPSDSNATAATVSGATASDKWFLRPGTNCQATFTGAVPSTDSHLASSDQVLINDIYLGNEEISLYISMSAATTDTHGLMDQPQGKRIASPQPGETWVCEVIARQPGVSLKLKPLRRITGLSLENVWLSDVNQRLIRVALERKLNLMMIGEQGCGKTTIAEAIAKHENCQFRPIAGNTIQKYTHLLGQNIPININGELRFRFEDSQFVQVLLEAQSNQTEQYISLIDEYNRIEPKGQQVLLSVVTGKERGLNMADGRVVAVPANVRFFAACNEGSAFSVTASDAANKDRWMIIKVDYMPKLQEWAHCMALNPDCPEAALWKAIDVINYLRAHKNDTTMRLSKNVSTRCAENTAALLTDGASLKTALETAVANQYVGSTSDKFTEAGRIAAQIAAQLAI